MIHLCCRYPQRDSLSHLYTHTLRTNTVSDQDSTFRQSRPGSYWCKKLEEENADCLGNVLKWAVIDFIPDLSSNQPSQFPHRSHRTQGTDRSPLSSGEICVPLSAKIWKLFTASKSRWNHICSRGTVLPQETPICFVDVADLWPFFPKWSYS